MSMFMYYSFLTAVQFKRAKGSIPLHCAEVKNDGMERVKRSIRYIFSISIPNSDRVYEMYHLTKEKKRERHIGENFEIL